MTCWTDTLSSWSFSNFSIPFTFSSNRRKREWKMVSSVRLSSRALLTATVTSRSMSASRAWLKSTTTDFWCHRLNPFAVTVFVTYEMRLIRVRRKYSCFLMRLSRVPCWMLPTQEELYLAMAFLKARACSMYCCVCCSSIFLALASAFLFCQSMRRSLRHAACPSLVFQYLARRYFTLTL